MTDKELKKLKDDLWHSADMLRSSAHLAANKYGQPILGIIFLRYADILFKQHKDEIFEKIWDTQFVGDVTLNVHIRHLREKLEEDPGNPKYIKTVWGVGFILNDE